MRFITIATTAALLFVGMGHAFPMIESRSTSPSLKSVTYTPLNADGTCQTSSQITSAIKQMKAAKIYNIRTYDQNCNQLSTILSAIKSVGGGMTILTGVRLDGSKNDDVEIATLKSILASKKNTQYIRGILVGNELVFGKVMTSSALVQKIKAVKSFAKGYKVGTAEIFTTYTQDLMDVSDIISVNLHPFFSNVDIKNAFSNLNAQYTSFKKLTKKKVYISETGWPSAGNSLGLAKPSVANMKTYATQLAHSNLPYYFFEWQDAAWKAAGVSPKSYEAHWGLLENGKPLFALNKL